MDATKFPKMRDKPSALIADIQVLEDRAARLRMFRAMHALNNAKNVAGWELARAATPPQGDAGITMPLPDPPQ